MTIATIPPPPFEEFHLGHFTLTVHGILILVPILLAAWITARRWRARGGRSELVWEVTLWTVVGGIVGARLYHVLTSWDQVPDEWWGPLAIWRGGLASWGALLGGTLAGVWMLRRRGVGVARFLDAAAPGVVVAFGIGRLGNYFNQELFGPPTDLPWALEVEPAFREEGYEDSAAFHPTFLYELAWDLALAGLLVAVERRFRLRPAGLFVLFLAGYSFGRIFEELFFRIDPAHHFFGLRLNFFVASGLFLAIATLFLRRQRRWRSEPAPTTRPRPAPANRAAR